MKAEKPPVKFNMVLPEVVEKRIRRILLNRIFFGDYYNDGLRKEDDELLDRVAGVIFVPGDNNKCWRLYIPEKYTKYTNYDNSEFTSHILAFMPPGFFLSFHVVPDKEYPGILNPYREVSF